MLPSQASVVVAGGGPAGYMAAIAAAEAGASDLLILEATPEPLHKSLRKNRLHSRVFPSGELIALRSG
jgi:flavin-dependent dehydrogenase